MSLRRIIEGFVPPLLFGAVFVLIWEAVVRVFDLKPFFLPAPSAIAEAFVDNIELIWEATALSGTNALVGLVAGTVVGVAASFLLMRFNILNELATPLAVALNAIPIIVLVSVFNNMFSITSEVPRRLMVTLVVFFIVLVNVANSKNAVAWAYVVGACLLGLTFYLISIALESITTHRRGSDPGGSMT